jgi:DhnA family fructose-bisphosphate aldolase class Ia
VFIRDPHTYCAGQGVGTNREALMTHVAAAVTMGMAGAAVGRQIWGSEDPVGVARQLQNIVHGVVRA